MLSHLDHVALVVRNLEEATTSFETLGFTVTPGGAHPSGSHVAFISFVNGTCLELFSFATAEGARSHRYWAALERSEGLVDWCAASDDLGQDVARHRAAELTIDDPVVRSRVRPDGVELRWRVAITTGPGRGGAPFLIEDEVARADRIPPATAHANGCTGIETIVVAVPTVDPARRWCRLMLDVEPTVSRRVAGAADALEARLGSVDIIWASPTDNSDALARHVALRGAGPFELWLRAPGANGGSLEHERAHGARLVMIG